MFINVSAHQKTKLASVEAARGVAALAVVLYHGSVTIRRPEFLGFSPFNGLFEFGHAGVEFFFVLSGFIMVYVHRDDIGHHSRLASYVRKRLTRIFPLFWFFMLIYGAKAFAQGQFSIGYFIKSALLLPQPPYPLIGQSWTLSHELVFYVLFGSFILSRWFGIVAFTCWAAAIMIAVISGQHQLPGDTLAFYNLLFFFGLTAAWLLKRRDVARPILALITGIAGILCVGLAENAGWITKETPASVCLFGAFSTVMIVALVSAERTKKLTIGPIGLLLGRLSYPLYLVHSMVVAGLGLAIIRSRPNQGAVLLIGYAVISCLAAYVVHRLFERPMILWLRKMHYRFRREGLE